MDKFVTLDSEKGMHEFCFLRNCNGYDYLLTGLRVVQFGLQSYS